MFFLSGACALFIVALCAAQMEPAAFGLATKVPKVLRPKLLESSSQEVAGFTLAVLHALTYLPLVLLPIMQDAHLKLVVVLNTTLCLCLMAGNVLFHFMGIVKVRALCNLISTFAWLLLKLSQHAAISSGQCFGQMVASVLLFYTGDRLTSQSSSGSSGVIL
jgi:hypothetical protein